jgi:predicted polyphosphate/ATP-dependent NAD kinase
MAALAVVAALARAGVPVRILTCAGPMGEDAASAAGLACEVVFRPSAEGGAATTAADTRTAAVALRDAGAELLVFAGGDGTARDVADAVGEAVPVVGIPAGVKIHSACYAVNPSAAGDLVAEVLRDGLGRLREAEVIDVDEAAYRDGRLETRVFGVVRVPDAARLLQAGKVRSRSDDAEADLLASAVVEAMEPGVLYVLGPGTTTRRVARRLGFEGTLLGVDLVRDGQLAASDVGERELLAAAHAAGQGRVRIIVTPTGGQGSLFGRGNQQISAAVIGLVGASAVIVIAAAGKLAALGGRPLLVDTGDESCDATLSGYLPVVTGPGRRAMYPVAAPRG